MVAYLNISRRYQSVCAERPFRTGSTEQDIRHCLQNIETDNCDHNTIIIIGIQPLGRSGQRPELSQATGMALVTLYIYQINFNPLVVSAITLIPILIIYFNISHVIQPPCMQSATLVDHTSSAQLHTQFNFSN